MNKNKYSIKTEIKNFSLQNYIEIIILNVMIILAMLGGYKDQRWAELIYIWSVSVMAFMFVVFSLILKYKVDPMVTYYSIYFFNLLICVVFGWWLVAICWAIILICAGVGMDRYLKLEKNKGIKKDENEK